MAADNDVVIALLYIMAISNGSDSLATVPGGPRVEVLKTLQRLLTVCWPLLEEGTRRGAAHAT